MSSYPRYCRMRVRGATLHFLGHQITSGWALSFPPPRPKVPNKQKCRPTSFLCDEPELNTISSLVNQITGTCTEFWLHAQSIFREQAVAYEKELNPRGSTHLQALCPVSDVRSVPP